MKELLILHVIFSLINLIVFYRKDKQKSIYRFIIVLFIPILGFLYILLPYIFRRRRDNDALKEYEEYIKKYREYKKVFKGIDVDREINLVPINEAIDLNNNFIKRQLIIDILKEDYKEHINVLKKALQDEDTETSHYAATGITEIKNEFQKELLKRKKNYISDKNIDNTNEYLNIIESYLESGLLDSNNYKEYENLYSNILEELLYKYKSEEKYYMDKINLEIRRKKFIKAKMFCDQFYKEYKNSENPYIMYMKLYYNLRDREKFKQKIEELISKDNIKLSNEGINIIRFWRGEL